MRIFNRVIGFSFLVFVASCNDETKTSTTSADTSTVNQDVNAAAVTYPPDPDYRNWQIPNHVAWAMIKAYKDDNRCPDFKIIPNRAIEDSIRRKFPNAITGYYIAKHVNTDLAKWARLRGWQPGDRRAEVNNKCTQLYAVWPAPRMGPAPAVAVADTAYFDIISVCPPPDDDCVSMLDALNATSDSSGKPKTNKK